MTGYYTNDPSAFNERSINVNFNCNCKTQSLTQNNMEFDAILVNLL